MSLTYSPRHPRRSLHNAYEPRVIRAASDTTSCLPTSPTRPRRQSSANPLARSLPTNPPSVHTVSSSHPPFPRPSYLDNSVLRNLLHTEQPPAPSSSRSDQQAQQQPRFISPHPQLRSAMSPPDDSDEDSNTSPPPRDTSSIAPPPPVVLQDKILRLPTRWSEDYRHPLLSVSLDGRDLTYQGASCSGDRDAAAARSDYLIPPACGIYYYEVEILCKGQKGHISIGFAASDVKLSRLPGWEANSWGYHGDDGCSFAAEKNGTAYGPTFGTGDVIGCGIDFATHRAFFTKNATFIGPVFENIGTTSALYPSIGLRHTGEAVRVNFGQEPFKFDIDYHVQQQRSQTWSAILTTPISSSILDLQTSGTPDADSTSRSVRSLSNPSAATEDDTKRAIDKLVLEYLAHHGYAKTVRAFQKQQDVGVRPSRPVSALSTRPSAASIMRDHDMEMDGLTSRPTPASGLLAEGDIELRAKIMKSVVDGDIDNAIAMLKEHHPAVLEAEEGLLLFKLRCRKFVELILHAAEMKKKLKAKTSQSLASPTSPTGSSGPSQPRGRAETRNGTSGLGGTGFGPQSLGSVADGMDIDEDPIIITPSSPSSSARSRVATNGTLPINIPRRRAPSSMSPTPGSPSPEATQYEYALHLAIAYGQSLQSDYRGDTRAEVRTLFKRTFGIVAWDDPVNAGGAAAEVAGVEARVVLANEVNLGILKSQGRPPKPTLETLYRHTSACITQLGLLGVGSAAFADMQKEFLDG